MAKCFVEHLEIRDLLSAVIVNTINDTDAVVPATSPNDSSGNISLRSAIEYLDANGGGSIGFNAALYASRPATITLGGTELAITQAMTISGPGASQLTIDANQKSRIFDVDDGNGTPDINVEIDGLNLIDGRVTGSDGSGGANGRDAFGGAIYNAQNLTLTSDTISFSLAQGGRGGDGIADGNGGNGGDGDGGGIYSTGSIALTNDTLTGNNAQGGRGGNGGIGGIDGNGGNGGNDDGGGIYSSSSLLLTNDTLTGNHAQGGDGGGSIDGYGGVGGLADGGGIFGWASLVLANDSLTANTAQGGAGSGNSGTGGGIGNGGGIYASANLVLSSSTLTGNVAQGGDGGTGSDGNGGGVYGSGSVILTNDTLTGNTAQGGSAASAGKGIGGGVYGSASLVLTNDTLTGNNAQGGDGGEGVNGIGGGVYGSAGLVLTNDTLTGNTAQGSGRGYGTGDGGGINSNGKTVYLLNTLLLGNTADTSPDLDGSLSTDGADNIVGLPNGVTLAQVLATDTNGKPLLANNGGSIKTIALVAGSPAIGQAQTLATLSRNVAATDKSFSVSEDAFLAVGDALRVDSEIIVVTAIDGSDITVTRGADGTAAATHAGGASLYLALDERGYVRVTNDMGAIEGPQQSITVNSTADAHADGFTTLREAITQANVELYPGGTVISFASRLSGTIELGQGELAITQPMTIIGPGASQITIDANQKSRIFDVDDGNVQHDINVEIDGLTMTNGLVTEDGLNGVNAVGGAIYNAENLTLTGDTITGNTAHGVSVGPIDSDANGGGIYSSGSLIATNDTLTGNTAQGGDGAPTYDGYGGYGRGGGIYSSGRLIATNDTLADNIAQGGAGGASHGGFGGYGGDGYGGGVFSDSLVLTNDTLTGNMARGGASGAVSAGNGYGGGLWGSVSLALANDTLTANSAQGGPAGAGLAGSGEAGGIYVYGFGANGQTIDLANTLLIGNTADTFPDFDGSLSANSAGNIVGLPVGDALSQVLATDGNGNPLLADNGGPTPTIALVPGSPAIGNAVALATLSDAVADAASTSFGVNDATYLAVGEALKVDTEIVLVTAISGTTITVARGADGTTAAPHARGAGLYLALDQRGYLRVTNDIGAVEGPQQSIVVNTTSDTHADGFTTLREAIAQANAEPWPGGTTITFAPGLTGTITLAGSELRITQAMTIIGPGASVLVVNGNNQSRIFDINDDKGAPDINVAITGLTLTGGNGAGYDPSGAGGAIINSEKLTISGDTISGNRTSEFGGDGGGIDNGGVLVSVNNTISGNYTGLNGLGGGIENSGTLTSANDAINENQGSDGGGIYNGGTLTLTNDTISGNQAFDGGGIENFSGTLTLTNGTICGNQVPGANGMGGGVSNLYGTLNIFNSILTGNSASTYPDVGIDSLSAASGNNLIGVPTGDTLSQVLATDTNGNALLANNGGPTQTIALAVGSPAIGAAKALSTLAASAAATDTTLTVADATYLAAGDAFKVDSEIILVTAISGTTITVTRGADGTTAVTHASGADLFLAFDQRGQSRNANSDLGAFETQVPTVKISVQSASQVYSGAADPVSADVVGLNSAAIATSPATDIAFAYYAGTLTVGQIAGATPLTGVPVNVGSYTVVANFNSDVAGYRDASSSPADFMITPAVLTVTANDNSKTYGQTAGDSGTISGVRNNDGITVRFASAGDAAGASVSGSPYSIVATLSDPNDKLGNYTLQETDGKLTVTPTVLTVTANDNSKTYGQTASDTGTTSGVLKNDGITASFASTGDAATAPVNGSPYSIVATLSDPNDKLGNYSIQEMDGKLTVNPFALTYQIGNDVQVRGTPANLTADLPDTISTGINSETLAIAYSSTGDTASAPLGQYPINGAVSNGSGLASNYAVTLHPGTLTVGLPPGVGYLAGVPGDGTPQTFVRNLYRELLGREPSAADLAYWTAQVQADSSVVGRNQVISVFMNSPEYKAHYIYTLYEVLLGRDPDAAGLQYWSAMMGNPGTPGEHDGSADEQFILAAIVGSDEFYAQAGGTDQSFVQALYHDLLGRAGDPADVHAWASLMHDQEQDRDGIVRNFLSAPETEHKLLDSFYPLPGGTAANPLPAPGDPVPDNNDDLAIVTGLGWENLYPQGPNGDLPEGNDAFFNALAGGMPWDDEQLVLLANDQF